MSKPQRIQLIDALKGFAILLVVVGHVLQGQLPGHDHFENVVYSVIYSFHMPLFMCLSGYVGARSLAKYSTREMLQKRFLTLVVPFLAWGAILFVVRKALAGEFLHMLGAPLFLGKLVLWPGLGLWFLWALFFAYVWALLLKLYGDRKGGALLAASFCLLLIFPWRDFLGLNFIVWLMPFFVLGYALAKQPAGASVRTGVKLLGLAAFPALMLLWERNDFIYVQPLFPAGVDFLTATLHLVYRYATALAGLAASYALVNALPGVIKDRLANLGLYSLDIYAIHFVVLQVLNAVFAYSGGMAVFYCVVLPVATLVVVCLTLFISRFIVRRNPHSRRYLLGLPA